MNPTKARKILWLVTVLVFLLLFGLTAIFTLLKPKTYAGTARVRLKGALPPADLTAFLATQADAAQSETILNPVAEDLHLNTLWGKKIRVDDDLKTWESVMLLKRKMQVSPLPESKEIEIRVEDDEGAEAAKIANQIAETICANDKTHALEVARRAEPDAKPVSPNIPLRLLLGALVSLGFAVAIGRIASWISLATGNDIKTT